MRVFLKNKIAMMLLLWCTVLLIGAGCSQAHTGTGQIDPSSSTSSGGICDYKGRHYAGSFYDECTICQCNNGSVICAPTDCPPKQLLETRCSYAGKEYYVGELVPEKGSCNNCTCREDGQVLCTYQLCKTEKR